MDNSALLKRAEDLKDRCQRKQIITSTAFLTPREQIDITRFGPCFFGGFADSERKIAVFLPEWCTEEDFNCEEYLSAIHIQSYFGTPSHRDYLGAIIGLGIERDRIGDIFVSGDSAYVVCLNTVCQFILNELTSVGRESVKLSTICLSDLPVQTKTVSELIFTVKSLRLDSVCSEIFGISRSNAADAIREGLVTLNYIECMKPDSQVHVEDILSLRGKGKGRIKEIGGKSRKDRTFVTAELFK